MLRRGELNAKTEENTIGYSDSEMCGSSIGHSDREVNNEIWFA
jgi:hypothetical protein